MTIESNQIVLLVNADELDTLRSGLELLQENGVWAHVTDKDKLCEADMAHDKRKRDAAERMLPQIYGRLHAISQSA
jgi:hypothetical protein